MKNIKNFQKFKNINENQDFIEDYSDWSDILQEYGYKKGLDFRIFKDGIGAQDEEGAANIVSMIFNTFEEDYETKKELHNNIKTETLEYDHKKWKFLVKIEK